MSIAELLPIVHKLTHAEKIQMMQVLLRNIAEEENVNIEINARPQARPIGMQKERFTVPQSFFDPLPDDLLDAFEGRD